MSRTLLHVLLLSIILMSSFGCNRKFRKYIENGAESVELAVTVPGRPNVQLGESNNTSQTTAGAILNAGNAMVSAAAGAQLQRRLSTLMSPSSVQQIAAQGALAELEGGYPLRLGDKQKNDGLMDLSLTSYGIRQEGGGPIFYASYNTRIYDKRKKRVYNRSTTCNDRDFFIGHGGEALSMVGTAITINYLNKLSDEELALRLNAAIDRCTSQVFRNMRRHAGRG